MQQPTSEEERGMIPRIAHLEDELEKRDAVITKLKKGNLALKVKVLFRLEVIDIFFYCVYLEVVDRSKRAKSISMQHYEPWRV